MDYIEIEIISTARPGLILCKDFSEKHDGTIWIKNDALIESTFDYTLHNIAT